MDMLAKTLTEVRTRQERRRRTRVLRAELAGYSTPAERIELEEIFARHETTPEDFLRAVA
jgi:hypothetical protein